MRIILVLIVFITAYARAAEPSGNNGHLFVKLIKTKTMISYVSNRCNKTCADSDLVENEAGKLKIEGPVTNNFIRVGLHCSSPLPAADPVCIHNNEKKVQLLPQNLENQLYIHLHNGVYSGVASNIIIKSHFGLCF